MAMAMKKIGSETSCPAPLTTSTEDRFGSNKTCSTRFNRHTTKLLLQKKLMKNIALELRWLQVCRNYYYTDWHRGQREHRTEYQSQTRLAANSFYRS
jgi:hypothetical protein